MRKQKTKPVTDVTFAKTDKQPIKSQLENLEFVAGRHSGEDIYDTKGCKLEAETILVQTHPTNRFLLCTRVGDRWHLVDTVAPDDPAVIAIQEAGQLVESGPRPSELEAQKKKAEVEARQWDAEEADKRRRKEIHEERRRKAIERQERALAERRAAM